MLSIKAIIRLSTLIAILAWVTLAFTDVSIAFSTTNNLKPGISKDIPPLMLSVFILSVFVFYKFRIEKAESVNFVDLLCTAKTKLVRMQIHAVHTPQELFP